MDWWNGLFPSLHYFLCTCSLIFLLSAPIFKTCNSNLSLLLILYRPLTSWFSLDSIHSWTAPALAVLNWSLLCFSGRLHCYPHTEVAHNVFLALFYKLMSLDAPGWKPRSWPHISRTRNWIAWWSWEWSIIYTAVPYVLGAPEIIKTFALQSLQPNNNWKTSTTTTTTVIIFRLTKSCMSWFTFALLLSHS